MKRRGAANHGNRQLQRGKLRIDRHPAPSERVTRICTNRFIQSMRHVEHANVSTARPPQVDDIQFMRGKHPNGIGTDQEAIGVKAERGRVIQIMKIELCGIAWCEKILPVEVRNDDALIAQAKGVQPAVRLFLQHVKKGQVVLVAVITQIAKQACPKVRIVKNKTAEIAIKELDP